MLHEDIAALLYPPRPRPVARRSVPAPGTADSFLPPKRGVAEETNFRPVRAADFLAQQPPEISWIWDAYLPEGTLALLVAYMKVGKSTFIYSGAVAVAQGRPFLGYPTRQGGVLMLAVEEHPRDVRRRLERFGMLPDDPLYVHSGPLTNSPETLRALQAFIAGYGIRLVVLDTLARFWSVTDENANAEVVRQVSPLLDLARQSGAAVVLVHHERKSGGDAGRGIRGGSALFGLVDQALFLERRQGGEPAHRLLRALGRYDETPYELILELNGDDYRALGSADELDKEAATHKVRACLSDDPQDVTTLARETGLTQRAVRTALEALAGQVGRDGAGRKGDPYTYRRLA